MLIEQTDISKVLQSSFPQLSEPDLQVEIAAVGTVHNFKAGETIMQFGSYIKMVPLVVSGSIKVSRALENDDKGLFLYYLQAGDTCAASFVCCMTEKQSSMHTEAEEDSVLIGIPIKYVDEWMGKYQSWRRYIMSIYDRKFMEMVQVLDTVAFQNLDTRMIDYLKKRVNSAKNDVIQASHQEIANDLNVSREAVSRLLKNMEKEGLVKLGRNQIWVKTKRLE